MRVYVVGDTGLLDGLALWSLADSGDVLLYVSRDDIPAPVLDELDRLAPVEIVVVGGPVRVSEAVANQLAGFAPVVRVAGGTRFTTPIAISNLVHPVEQPVEPPVPHVEREIIGPFSYSGPDLLVIEDKIIDGGGGYVAVRGSNGGVLLRNCLIINAQDGLKNMVSTENCVIDGLWRIPGGHVDCMQIEGSADVTHTGTTFMAFDQDGDYGNACFQIKSDFAPGTSQKAIFTDCHFDGGNYHGMVDDGPRGGYAHVELHNCTYTDDTRWPELNFQGPYAVKNVTVV